MTNREWLNGLTDYELAQFLTSGLKVASGYSVSIHDILRRYTLSTTGIREWFSEEQEYEGSKE